MMILIPLCVIKLPATRLFDCSWLKKLRSWICLQIHFMAKMATSITFPSFYRKLEDVDAAPCSRQCFLVGLGKHFSTIKQKVLYVYTYSAKMKILFIYQSVLILRRKVIKMISTLASKLAAVEPNCQLDLKLNAGIL